MSDTMTDAEFEASATTADNIGLTDNATNGTELVMASPSNGKGAKIRKLPEPKAYKPAEAKAMDEELRQIAGKDRILWTIFVARKGYAALGFSSLDDYVEKSEWIDTSVRTINRWISAVRVTAEGMGKSIADLEAMVAAGETLRVLPNAVSREITKLPTPALRQEAVQKLQGDGETTHGIMGAGQTVTRAQSKDVKNIVRQIVVREHIEVKPKSDTTAAANEAKPKPPKETPKPEPMKLTNNQYADGEEALNTLLTFVQNQQVLCDDKDCRAILADVRLMCDWAESYL